MKPHGTYKLASRHHAIDDYLDALARSEGRVQRIVESLRSEIVEGGAGRHLRIRQILGNPREIYRVELELPEMNYSRTTLLDRDALETLLENAEVRSVLTGPGG